MVNRQDQQLKEKLELKKGYKKTILGWIPDAWEITKLGKLYDFKNGLNKEKEFFGYGTPIINYMDVFNFTSLDNENIKGKVFLSDSEIERFNIKRGDVFFTRTSETINEIAYSSVLIEDVGSGVFSGFVLRARPTSVNNIDLNFAKYCFSTQLARKEIIRKSSFTTRALTNGRFLSEVNLLLPPKQEQKKIAKILSTWDRAIQIQEELIASKQTFKKGLMQVLLTGKKRFDRFNDEWEELIFKEVCSINPKSETLPEEFIYIDLESVENGRLKSENKKFKRNAPSRAQRLLKYDDILYQTVRPYQKNNLHFELNGDYVASTGYAQLRANESSKFLYQLLYDNTFVHQVIIRCTGTSYPSINTSALAEIKVRLPSKQEQDKIASILSRVDEDIELLEQQLIQLLAQKQGLMQQLLTGMVRVKTNKE